ncbi:MAG TPA: hypothetical protein VGH33_16460 [Isosphaeraceae bacterium]
MPSRRIVNASPLILLTKAGRLDLLRLDVAEVIVPDVVVAEVGAKDPHDPAARAVAEAAWIAVKPAPPMPDPVRACGLDPGESAVLAWRWAMPSAKSCSMTGPAVSPPRGWASHVWERSAWFCSRGGWDRSRRPGP